MFFFFFSNGAVLLCVEEKKKKKALISPLEKNELKLNYSREQRTFRWREHISAHSYWEKM